METYIASILSGSLPWLLAAIFGIIVWFVSKYHHQKYSNKDQDKRLDKIEDRLDAIESYDASITDRLHKLESEILQRLTAIETALDYIKKNGH